MSYDTPAPDAETTKPVDPETAVDENDLDPEVPAHHGDKPDETPVEAQP